LLIVLNEKHKRKRNLDVSAMRKQFTNISEMLEVDFAEEDKSRLNKLKQSVKYYVSQLPHIGNPVPAKWKEVREAIERDLRNTITVQDYLKICQDNGITKRQDALVLSQYFHDIGVFLHFQSDDLLQKIIFLKPNWATNTVYKVLDHPILDEKHGRFNKEDANTIWCEEEYAIVCSELLRLMQKFFLIYQVDHSDEYIIPARLIATQPSYPWDEQENLFLHYKYDLFMPKGILSQFTVQMHRYINNHDYVWRRGVVLERDNTTAEVIESYDARSIKIRISGLHRRDFMTIITEQFDQINAQYKKMKVDKMIPCNCEKCKRENPPHFYEYNKLKRRLEKNRHDIECENSFDRVNIRSLIDEVIIEDRKNFPERELPPPPVKVKRNKIFVSYAHKDKEALEKIRTHLKVLENEGISVNLWDDTKIEAGMNWLDEIEKGLSSAKVAILLVSTDFLASEFISTNELPRLLKAAEKDGAIILPVILKPCRFAKHKQLSEFQAVNDPAKPLSKLTEDEQDEVLLALTDRIEKLMNDGGLY